MKTTTDPWLERWNKRFSQKDYAYGRDPNEYLREQLNKLTPGTILFGAEGEGRNAVFAATQGWTVSAFDISAEGKKKALRLATESHVTIDYKVGKLPELKYSHGQFDAIALIYAHFPADIRSQYHKLLDSYLHRGGTVILEAFSKNHPAYRAQNEKVGGPTELELLFSVGDIQSDFGNYEIIELKEAIIELHEGLYHNGKGSVIRFVGRKK